LKRPPPQGRDAGGPRPARAATTDIDLGIAPFVVIQLAGPAVVAAFPALAT
jgi:hypothetical protein